MAKYVKANGYPTEHLIDSLTDEALLAHMDVPRRYVAHAMRMAESGDLPVGVKVWLDRMPYIFRPSDENLREEPDMVGQGLILTGPPSTRKTTTAAAILLQVIRRKIPNTDPTGRNRTWHGACMGAFVDWQWASDLFRSANHDEDLEEQAQTLRNRMMPGGPVLKRADFLIIDDISRERVTDYNLNELQRTLRQRADNGFPTILTTNHAEEDWDTQHGPVLAAYLRRSFFPIRFDEGE